MDRAFRIAMASVVAVLLASCSGDDDEVLVITDGHREVALRIEVADGEHELIEGLSQREELPANSGMLFVFPHDVRPALWMHGTSLPLEAAFLDGAGKVLEIVALEPHSLEVHQGPAGARYVLEVNAGWFAKHGLNQDEQLAVLSLEGTLHD